MNPDDTTFISDTIMSRKKSSVINTEPLYSKEDEDENINLRRHPRKVLLRHVARSTKIIEALQERRNKWLDSFFVISSFLGDKLLYSLLFPYLFWIQNPYLGRMCLYLLITGTTIGNILKNTFALPRPPSPPLWSPKQLYDFGMPSTHSLNAVTMPWFFLYITWDSYTTFTAKAAMIIILSLYSISMFISRMYLAAHSHVDVISGIILGLSILTLWINWHTHVNNLLTTHPYSFEIVCLIALCVIVFHPRSSRPSPSLGYTIALMGIITGAALGIHRTIHLGTTSPIPFKEYLCGISVKDWILTNIQDEMLQKIAFTTIPILIGLVIMFGSFGVVKVSSFFILGIIFQLGGVANVVEFAKTNIIKLALPHPTAFDNLDYPQFGRRETVKTTKQEAKTIANFCATFTVGFVVTNVVPVLLNCISLMPESLLKM